MSYRFIVDSESENRTLDIPGASDKLADASPDAPGVRRYHYGTRGESEIRGLQAGRQLTGIIWIYDSITIATIAQLDKKIEEIRYFVNKHGKLEKLNQLGGVEQTLEDVTFEGYTFPNVEGGSIMTPLDDIGGCLGGGAWVEMHTRWRQLYVPSYFDVFLERNPAI